MLKAIVILNFKETMHIMIIIIFIVNMDMGLSCSVVSISCATYFFLFI